MEAEATNEILKKDFSTLTENNKKSVIEMTRFLVLTQNTIVPKILTPENDPVPVESEGGEQTGNFANTGRMSCVK